MPITQISLVSSRGPKHNSFIFRRRKNKRLEIDWIFFFPNECIYAALGIFYFLQFNSNLLSWINYCLRPILLQFQINVACMFDRWALTTYIPSEMLLWTSLLCKHTDSTANTALWCIPLLNINYVWIYVYMEVAYLLITDLFRIYLVYFYIHTCWYS